MDKMKRFYIRWIILSTIFFLMGYFGNKIYKILKTHDVILTSNGILVSTQPADYPKTDNPVMEGVTIKEYIAVEKK